MFHVDRLGELIRNNLNLTIATTTAAASLALLYLYRGNRQIAMTETISLDNQTFEIEPGVRCSHLAPDGKLVRYFIPEVRTTHEVFCYGKEVSKNGPCIGSRTGPANEYEWTTYQQVYDTAQRLGSAFIEKGVAANNESLVGICAANCPQWVFTEQACSMFSMVVVPLYTTLGVDAMRSIVNITNIPIVVCGTLSLAKQFIRFRTEGATHLQCIVVIESIDAADIEAARDDNVDLVPFRDMLEIGAVNKHDPVPPSADDVCSIYFTSGTTGDPKGVVITHENLLANVAAGMKQTFDNDNFGPEDVHISYLPLAHVFERNMQVIMFHIGGRVGFSRGDPKLLLDDIQALKPTFFVTVPRLLNVIHSKITDRVKESFIKSMLFNFALNRKMELLKRGIVRRDTIWDKLVFGRVQQSLGGRVKFIISGSAPLSSDVHDFLRCAFGCAVLQGFGQTECTGVTLNLLHENNSGHTGPVLPCSLLKVVSVPEMNYMADDGCGEVCVKGPGCTKEYYKDPVKTRETIDEDGWLHTGDIGRINENGTLSIIARKKHHFKLSQGEYITPDRLEGVYSRSRFILQVFLDGESSQRFPVAIVVPEPELVLTWAANHQIAETDMEHLCKNELLKKAIIDDFNVLAVEEKLNGFEKVHNIYLHPEPFTVDNGLVTPTMKNRRLRLRNVFGKQIQNLYKD